MPREACQHLTGTLAHEQNAIPPVPNIRAALANPAVLWLCAQYLLWSIGVYGFVLWLPSIVQKGASRGIAITGLLSAIPYAFAILLMVAVSHFSDRNLQRKRFIWPFLIVAGVALFSSYLVSGSHFWWSFGLLVVAGSTMYAPYGPFFAIIPELLPANVAGEVTALINSCGALGAFLGSYLVGLLEAQTGNNRAGFLLMSIAVTLSGLIILALRTQPAAVPQVRAGAV